MQGLGKKRVLITGGAGAIGTETAVRFLEEGSLVVVLDRDQAALERAADDLQGLGGSICADVTDPDGIARAFDELDAIAGGLDILINNAGIKKLPAACWLKRGA